MICMFLNTVKYLFIKKNRFIKPTIVSMFSLIKNIEMKERGSDNPNNTCINAVAAGLDAMVKFLSNGIATPVITL